MNVLFDSSGKRFEWQRLNHLYDFVYDSIFGKRPKNRWERELRVFVKQLSSEEKIWFDYVVVSEIEHEYAGHVDSLSLLAASEGSRPIGGDAVPQTGYAPFMEDLAEGLNIHLSTRVSQISHDEFGVTVTTDKQDFTSLPSESLSQATFNSVLIFQQNNRQL